MKKKKTGLIFGLALMLILTSAVLIGCSSENPLQAKLLGTWSNVAEDGSTGKMEFYDDNTFLFNADGDEKTLQYKIIGEDYPAMILISDIGDDENFYKSEFSFESDEQLIFKLEDGSEVTMTKN